jgi:hypothetical protein
MIFGNLGQALRVSVGPYLILVGAVSALFFAIGLNDGFGFGTGQPPTNVTPLLGILPLLMLPAILFVTAWVAVSWHRFILLEERTGWLPAIKGRPIWAYAGRAILLGLMIMLLALPVMIVAGLIGSRAPLLAIPFFVVGLTLLGFVGLKMGVSLVGTALGKTMQAGDVWRATERINGTIIGVVVLMVVINVVPGLIIQWISLSAPIIGFVLNIILNWVSTMLGISILTTIYGHVIEDRPLVS